MVSAVIDPYLLANLYPPMTLEMIPDGQHTQLARSLKKQRFLVSNTRPISFLAFGLVLFVVLKFGGDNRLWALPVFLTCGGIVLFAAYSLLVLYGVVGVRCPHCGTRFKTDVQCSTCGFSV
jgi:hypothetical protein